MALPKHCCKALSAALAGLLFSQLGWSMNLLDVVEKARQHDASYLAATHKFSADSETYRQARSRLLPTLSFQYEKRTTDQSIIRADNSVFATGNDKFDTTTEGLTLKQPLFDWELWSRFQQSKSTISRAESELMKAEQDLLLRAAEGYFLVLEVDDQLTTIKDEKDALKQHFEMAASKKKAGLGRSVDVDSAEARYLESLAREAELNSQLVDTRYALAEIIGTVPDTLDFLSEAVVYQPPEPVDSDTWVKSAGDLNPAILALKHALDEARQEVRARKSGHYPTLNFTYTDGKRETGGSLFGGGNELKTKEMVFTVDVPIFQGMYISSRVEQAVQDEFRAEEELTRVQRENERSVRDSFHKTTASIVRVDALQRSVEAQGRTLVMKERGYASGRFNLLEVLDAQKDLSAATQSHTKAKYDFVLNTLRLKHAAGQLSVKDIAAINSWLTAS